MTNYTKIENSSVTNQILDCQKQMLKHQEQMLAYQKELLKTQVERLEYSRRMAESLAIIARKFETKSLFPKNNVPWK